MKARACAVAFIVPVSSSVSHSFEDPVSFRFSLARVGCLRRLPDVGNDLQVLRLIMLLSGSKALRCWRRLKSCGSCRLTPGAHGW